MASAAHSFESFFFQGLPGFLPVVRAENYNVPGGIRTSEITGKVDNRMYQFQRYQGLRKRCVQDRHDSRCSRET